MFSTFSSLDMIVLRQSYIWKLKAMPMTILSAAEITLFKTQWVENYKQSAYGGIKSKLYFQMLPWYKHDTNMIHTWYKHDTNMIQTWYKHDTNIFEIISHIIIYFYTQGVGVYQLSTYSSHKSKQHLQTLQWCHW